MNKNNNNLLRKGISTICNLDLTDLQWLQASLPVKDGGLGVCRVSLLASSAFLASATATDTLQQQLLLRSSIAGTTDASVSMVRDCRTGPAATKQSTWDRAVTALERNGDQQPEQRHRQSSAADSYTSPHSSDWLHTLPLPGCGLRLDDCAIHIVAGLRLGALEPHQCPCEAPVDARGLHGLSCRGGNGRSARRHSLNDLVWRAMAKADIPALKEPSGLLRTDGKRPGGVTLLPWKQRKCVTWDVTVSDTLAQSYVHETSQTSGAAAEAAAERKRNKYLSFTQSYFLFQSRLIQWEL